MQTQTADQARINSHVERVRKGAAAALSLLDWLDAEGIRALYITVESARAKPIIHIALSIKCTWLKDKHAAYKHVIANHYTTWRADILGCRLQWTEAAGALPVKSAAEATQFDDKRGP